MPVDLEGCPARPGSSARPARIVGARQVEPRIRRRRNARPCPVRTVRPGAARPGSAACRPQRPSVSFTTLKRSRSTSSTDQPAMRRACAASARGGPGTGRGSAVPAAVELREVREALLGPVAPDVAEMTTIAPTASSRSGRRAEPSTTFQAHPTRGARGIGNDGPRPGVAPSRRARPGEASSSSGCSSSSMLRPRARLVVSQQARRRGPRTRRASARRAGRKSCRRCSLISAWKRRSVFLRASSVLRASTRARVSRIRAGVDGRAGV